MYQQGGLPNSSETRDESRILQVSNSSDKPPSDQPPPIPLPVFPNSLSPLSAVSAIEFLHRGEGAVVTFHRKNAECWQNLGGILVRDLRERFVSLRESLFSDSYFLINSTYVRPTSNRTSDLTGLPFCSRRQEALRWLNAFYVDVDAAHNNEDFCVESLLASLLTELDRAGFPTPSVVVFSGRGVWLLWPLVDHADRGRPVQAFPEKCEIYKRINRALANRFRHFGADVGSTDPSRVMRVAGSLNTKAPNQYQEVKFYKHPGEFNTMPEFADLLGLRARKITFSEKRVIPKDEARVRAGIARWSRPLEGFLDLWKVRGHFGERVRHSAVYIYALLLRRNRVCISDIVKRCESLGRACVPPLSAADIRRCVSSSRKAVSGSFDESISNTAIANMLQITCEEKATLAGWFKPPAVTRADKIANRRNLIVLELKRAAVFGPDRGRWIAARKMSQILSVSHMIKVSHVTMLEDYRSIYGTFFRAGGASLRNEQLGKFRGG